MVLLDTDVMVDLLREYPPALEWITAHGEQIVLPGYVVMELIQGCKNKSEQERLEKPSASMRLLGSRRQIATKHCLCSRSTISVTVLVSSMR